MPGAKPIVKPVKLVCGILHTRDTNLGQIESKLISLFGQIDEKSKSFDFIFTDYYAGEMGGDLKKYFCSFERLITPDNLPDIKNHTIETESKSAIEGNRTVNLDPGYLEESKLVLASTKNFSHRIYLRDGIWAEVTLRFIRNNFATHDWTYPDWSQDLTLDFLKKVRDVYKGQLGGLTTAIE